VPCVSRTLPPNAFFWRIRNLPAMRCESRSQVPGPVRDGGAERLALSLGLRPAQPSHVPLGLPERGARRTPRRPDAW